MCGWYEMAVEKLRPLYNLLKQKILIATCKSAEIDPRIWMEDVLSKISYYERDEKNMEELLPRN